jgi:hypothetical protein
VSRGGETRIHRTLTAYLPNGERVGETPRPTEHGNMMKHELLAIRTYLSRAQLLGLVVSMAACDPSVYTREPGTGLTVTTGATGGSASAVPGVGGAFQLQGNAAGESGGPPAAAATGSGGSQEGQAPSGAAGISGTGGTTAASATGGASRTETGGASGGRDSGAQDATPSGSGSGGGAGSGSGGGSGGGGQDAGTAMAGSGGASAGGRAGGVASPDGGSAAGGSGPTGSGGRDVAEYGFELSVSGWQMSSDSGGVATLTRGTSRPFAGAASLEGAIVSSGAELVQVFVQSPAVAPGSRVTFHFFVPSGAPIDWAEAFIQEGALSTPAFAWTYAYLKTPELVFGAWNTVTVALASTATAPIAMGVQFHLASRWAGSVFVDSISW